MKYLIFFLLLLSACSTNILMDNDGVVNSSLNESQTLTSGNPTNLSIGLSWRSTELLSPIGTPYTIDSITDPTFIIFTQDGCVMCEQQIREINTARVVHMFVNTNLDADTVPDLHFRTTPEFISLIEEEFGPEAINLENSPVIFVCPTGEDQLLEPGLRSSEELAEIYASCEA